MFIKTKNNLKKCLEQDAKNYPISHTDTLKDWIYRFLFRTPISDQTKIWSYIVTLRKLEYSISNNNWIYRIFYSWRLRKLSYKTGFQIPPNVIEPGLTIWHWGTIIINEGAKIGKNFTCQPQVVIGHTTIGNCPIIGDNVTIFGGCIIVGKIHIGNNVIVAPNSVVINDVPDNVLIGGSPAKIIKHV